MIDRGHEEIVQKSSSECTHGTLPCSSPSVSNNVQLKFKNVRESSYRQTGNHPSNTTFQKNMMDHHSLLHGPGIVRPNRTQVLREKQRYAEKEAKITEREIRHAAIGGISLPPRLQNCTSSEVQMKKTGSNSRASTPYKKCESTPKVTLDRENVEGDSNTIIDGSEPTKNAAQEAKNEELKTALYVEKAVKEVVTKMKREFSLYKTTMESTLLRLRNDAEESIRYVHLLKAEVAATKRRAGAIGWRVEKADLQQEMVRERKKYENIISELQEGDAQAKSVIQSLRDQLDIRLVECESLQQDKDELQIALEANLNELQYSRLQREKFSRQYLQIQSYHEELIKKKKQQLSLKAKTDGAHTIDSVNAISNVADNWDYNIPASGIDTGVPMIGTHQDLINDLFNISAQIHPRNNDVNVDFFHHLIAKPTANVMCQTSVTAINGFKSAVLCLEGTTCHSKGCQTISCIGAPVASSRDHILESINFAQSLRRQSLGTQSLRTHSPANDALSGGSGSQQLPEFHGIQHLEIERQVSCESLQAEIQSLRNDLRQASENEQEIKKTLIVTKERCNFLTETDTAIRLENSHLEHIMKQDKLKYEALISKNNEVVAELREQINKLLEERASMLARNPTALRDLSDTVDLSRKTAVMEFNNRATVEMTSTRGKKGPPSDVLVGFDQASSSSNIRDREQELLKHRLKGKTDRIESKVTSNAEPWNEMFGDPYTSRSSSLSPSNNEKTSRIDNTNISAYIIDDDQYEYVWEEYESTKKKKHKKSKKSEKTKKNKKRGYSEGGNDGVEDSSPVTAITALEALLSSHNHVDPSILGGDTVQQVSSPMNDINGSTADSKSNKSSNKTKNKNIQNREGISDEEDDEGFDKWLENT